jgi:hypothetical protein
VADTIITFEGTVEQYRAARFPAWTADYPAWRFAADVYRVSRHAGWREVLHLARARNTGYVYFTDDGGSRLPADFADQRRAIARATR